MLRQGRECVHVTRGGSSVRCQCLIEIGAVFLHPLGSITAALSERAGAPPAAAQVVWLATVRGIPQSCPPACAHCRSHRRVHTPFVVGVLRGVPERGVNRLAPARYCNIRLGCAHTLIHIHTRRHDAHIHICGVHTFMITIVRANAPMQSCTTPPRDVVDGHHILEHPPAVHLQPAHRQARQQALAKCK